MRRDFGFVGIADQKPDMFLDDRFMDLQIDHARINVAWDALSRELRSSGLREAPPPLDGYLADGDRVSFGSCELEVIRITGHTPGSICLLYRDPEGHPHLFTGDSLFPGGVGNTFGDKDAFATLVDDVEAKLFGVLPDDTWFYPGHGNDSNLGAERPHVAEWRERGW